MRRVSGFTLTELVITVAIVAILAGIALPSYRAHIVKTHRAEAMDALMRIAAAQEKFFLQNNTYTGTLGAGGLELDDESEREYYDLATEGSSSTFTATATVNASNGMEDDEDCWVFAINERGARTAQYKDESVNEDCWP